MNTKIDVPEENWDKLASPAGTAVMITTVDREGRISERNKPGCLFAVAFGPGDKKAE